MMVDAPDGTATAVGAGGGVGGDAGCVTRGGHVDVAVDGATDDGFVLCAPQRLLAPTAAMGAVRGRLVAPDRECVVLNYGSRLMLLDLLLHDAATVEPVVATLAAVPLPGCFVHSVVLLRCTRPTGLAAVAASLSAATTTDASAACDALWLCTTNMQCAVVAWNAAQRGLVCLWTSVLGCEASAASPNAAGVDMHSALADVGQLWQRSRAHPSGGPYIGLAMHGNRFDVASVALEHSTHASAAGHPLSAAVTMHTFYARTPRVFDHLLDYAWLEDRHGGLLVAALASDGTVRTPTAPAGRPRAGRADTPGGARTTQTLQPRLRTYRLDLHSHALVDVASVRCPDVYSCALLPLPLPRGRAPDGVLLLGELTAALCHVRSINAAAFVALPSHGLRDAGFRDMDDVVHAPRPCASVSLDARRHVVAYEDGRLVLLIVRGRGARHGADLDARLVADAHSAGLPVASALCVLAAPVGAARFDDDDGSDHAARVAVLLLTSCFGDSLVIRIRPDADRLSERTVILQRFDGYAPCGPMLHIARPDAPPATAPTGTGPVSVANTVLACAQGLGEAGAVAVMRAGLHVTERARITQPGVVGVWVVHVTPSADGKASTGGGDIVVHGFAGATRCLQLDSLGCRETVLADVEPHRSTRYAGNFGPAHERAMVHVGEQCVRVLRIPASESEPHAAGMAAWRPPGTGVISLADANEQQLLVCAGPVDGPAPPDADSDACGTASAAWPTLATGMACRSAVFYLEWCEAACCIAQRGCLPLSSDVSCLSLMTSTADGAAHGTVAYAALGEWGTNDVLVLRLPQLEPCIRQRLPGQYVSRSICLCRLAGQHELMIGMADGHVIRFHFDPDRPLQLTDRHAALMGNAPVRVVPLASRMAPAGEPVAVLVCGNNPMLFTAHAGAVHARPLDVAGVRHACILSADWLGESDGAECATTGPPLPLVLCLDDCVLYGTCADLWAAGRWCVRRNVLGATVRALAYAPAADRIVAVTGAYGLPAARAHVWAVDPMTAHVEARLPLAGPYEPVALTVCHGVGGAAKRDICVVVERSVDTVCDVQSGDLNRVLSHLQRGQSAEPADAPARPPSDRRSAMAAAATNADHDAAVPSMTMAAAGALMDSIGLGSEPSNRGARSSHAPLPMEEMDPSGLALDLHPPASPACAPATTDGPLRVVAYAVEVIEADGSERVALALLAKLASLSAPSHTDIAICQAGSGRLVMATGGRLHVVFSASWPTSAAEAIVGLRADWTVQSLACASVSHVVALHALGDERLFLCDPVAGVLIVRLVVSYGEAGTLLHGLVEECAFDVPDVGTPAWPVAAVPVDECGASAALVDQYGALWLCRVARVSGADDAAAAEPSDAPHATAQLCCDAGAVARPIGPLWRLVVGSASGAVGEVCRVSGARAQFLLQLQAAMVRADVYLCHSLGGYDVAGRRLGAGPQPARDARLIDGDLIGLFGTLDPATRDAVARRAAMHPADIATELAELAELAGA